MRSYYFLMLLFFFQLRIFAQLPVFTLNTSVVHANCPNNGQILFSASNTAPGSTVIFQIFELPSNILLSSNSIATSVNSLPPGNYSVVATQNLGIQSNSQSTTVTINSTYTPLVYGTPSVQNVVCGNDGVITANILSGTPTYTYELFAGSITGPLVGPLQGSPTFSNLSIGTYIVRTFDACGNAFPSLPITIGNNPPHMDSLANQVIYSTLSCDSVDVNLQLFGSSNSFPITSILSYTDGVTLHTVAGNANGTFPPLTVGIANFPITFTAITTDVCGNVDTLQTVAVLNLGQDNSHKNLILCNQYYYTFAPSSFFANSGYSINFTNSPTGFNPLTYNTSHPGLFYSSTDYGGPTNPLPAGNYTAVLTNNCNASYTLNFSTFPIIDSFLNSNSDYIDCQLFKVAVYKFGFVFDSAYILQAPSTYNQILPFDVTDSLNQPHYIANALVLTLAPGFYKFKLIDTCGNVRYHEINLIAPPLSVSYGSLPGCEIGFGSAKVGLVWSLGQSTFLPSVIQNCWITNAPIGYGNTLPHDLTSMIAPGNSQFHIGGLIPGVYTFSLKNTCGDSTSQTMTIAPFSIATTNFEFTTHCNYINLRFDVIKNNPNSNFRLQQNINGTWTTISGIAGGNVWTNYLTLAEGNYRIVLLNVAFSSINLIGQVNYENCYPNWSIPFTVDYPDPEIDAINIWDCSIDNYNAYVSASGEGPISYNILEYNGAPFVVNNGNNPLFTNLSEGFYLFQIVDACGNIRTRYMEIRLVNNYIFPDSICENQNGSLSIYGFSGVNTTLGFKWWKASNPSTILSTTSSLSFTPYNNSINQGQYFVEIYSLTDSTLCPDTVSYLLNTNIIPTAGLDSTAQICNDSTIIDLSQFLSPNATNGGFWSDTTHNLTFYGSQLDLSSTPNDTITVFYTVHGTCDFKDTAVFTFIVTQLDSVQVICPNDTLIYGCPQNVDWATPIFYTSCSALDAFSNFNQNDFFPLDTTLVAYTCTGPLGDVNTCNFNVIILDTIQPQITCPNDSTIFSNSSTCGALFNWPTPTYLENCDSNAILTLTSIPSGLQSGSVFPAGTNTLTYTLAFPSGMTDQCSFTLTVVDTTNPIISSCSLDTVLTNLNGLCSANYSWISPQFDDNCDDSLTVWFESAPTVGLTNGGAFPVGNTTITYYALDNYGNIDSCFFTITVLDLESPQILNCPVDTVLFNTAGICGAVYNWVEPSFTDNCDNSPMITLTSSPTIGLQNGDTLPVGTTQFMYLVTDLYGNSDSCSFTVTVQDNEAPTYLNCPMDTTISSNLDMCSAIFNWNTPLIIDNCDIGPTLSYQTFPTVGLNPGDPFPLGQTTIEYTATDAMGNQATCSFNVFVEDNQNPLIINCPNDTTVTNEDSICGAHVSWVLPLFSDNCDTSLTITLSSSPTAGLQSGDLFPVGSTTMNYLVVDANGNQANCSFTIEVIDVEYPLIQNIPTQILDFCDGDNVYWDTIWATDNCTVVSFDYQTSPSVNLTEGNPFPIGNTTVTYIAIDQAGNTTMDSFVVHVNPILTAKVSGFHKACKDDSSLLAITFTCNNGVAPFEFIYAINGGPNQSIISPVSNTISIYHPTSISDTFYYELIDVMEGSGNSCPPILIDSCRVIIYPLPNATISGDTMVCQFSDPTSILFTGSNATPSYFFDYTINGGLNQQIHSLNGQDSRSILTVTSEPGDFVYTLNRVTESENNCQQQLSQSVLIAVKPLPIASFYCSPSFITESNNVVQLINESEGETSYLWDFNDGTYSSVIYSPYHQFSVDSESGYTIVLTVVNEFNCVDTAIRTIHVKKDPLIYVPNAFTPNGSSINEIFIPVMTDGIDEQNYLFTIFNRWGEVVFETNSTKEGWDGYTKTNQFAPDGVYVWTIKYRVYESSEMVQLNGHVSLLR